jgi:23S rRNA-/tRNA-specific pseudouridylate synthase
MIQNKKTPYKKTSTRGATGASKRRAKNLRPTSTGRTTMRTNARPPVARVAKPRVANSYPMRLNKYLAQMSIASRREADALIEKGSIFVNGKKSNPRNESKQD